MVVLSLDKPARIRRPVLSRALVVDESGPVALRRDPLNVVLALVNWMVLLLLLCGLLLAYTLPTRSSSDVIGGVSSVTCHAKTCGKVQPAG
jgi:hypothetical protein